VWAIGYVTLGVVTFVGWLPQPDAPPFEVAVRMWGRWDTEWFLGIATGGYRGPGVDTVNSPAFFPMYPMLVGLADAVLPGGPLGAAAVVSALALLGALTVLHRLVERELGEDTAGRTLWYLVAFPTGFFLFIAYNHGLDLLFVALCFLFVRQERWWWAGLAGAAATATRSSGVLLLGVFAYEYLRRHGRRPRLSALAIVVVPAGLLAFMAYLWQDFGNPFAFADAQDHWGRSFDWPWHSVPQVVSNAGAIQHGLDRLAVTNLLDLCAAVVTALMLALGVVGPWKLRRDQLVYPLYGFALLAMLVAFPSRLPAVAEPLVSISRLVLAEFPAFMVLALAGRNVWVDRTYLAVAVPLQGILAAYLLHGGWVA
jgi:hypothetical protein